MSQFRVCPTGEPGRTRMEFDYYNLESGEGFEEYYRFVRQVALEDYELCEKAQGNLERGIYAEGILNPVKETGVACKCFLPNSSSLRCSLMSIADYQQRVLEMVLSQHQEDKKQQQKTLERQPTTAGVASEDELDRSSYSGNSNFTCSDAGIVVST